MSLATNQATLIISVAKGFLELLVKEPQLPVEIAPTILWANQFCGEVLARYPETGDPIKNMHWQKKALHQWDHLGKQRFVNWHPAVVSVFALNLLEDLLEKVRNHAREDLVVLRDTMANISYFFSETGKEYDLFEEATQVTEDLYKAIGFSR